MKTKTLLIFLLINSTIAMMWLFEDHAPSRSVEKATGIMDDFRSEITYEINELQNNNLQVDSRYVNFLNTLYQYKIDTPGLRTDQNLLIIASDDNFTPPLLLPPETALTSPFN